jgi:hypothetical protein
MQANIMATFLIPQVFEGHNAQCLYEGGWCGWIAHFDFLCVLAINT